MHRALASTALILLLSCGKEDPASPSVAASASVAPSATVAPSVPPPSATAPAPASASTEADAPPLPKCPSGLVGNAVPAYCIRVPPAYHVKQARLTPKRGSVEYDTGTTTDNLMISFDESPIAQLSKDVESEMKFGGDKLDKKGNLAGGGKWFQGTHAEYSRIVTLVKGPGALTLKCSFAYQPKKPPPKESIESCKSIVVP